MSIKSTVKIALDIIMTILFLLLLFANGTSLVFHEIMGIVIVLLLGLHLALNWKWIVGVSKRLVHNGLEGKTLWMYVLNIGLFVGFFVIVTTGLMISTVVLPQEAYNQNAVFIHKWASYITAGLIAGHIMLHAKYIAHSIRKVIANIKTIPVVKGLSSIFAMVAVIAFLYYHIAISINGIQNESPAIASTVPATIPSLSDNASASAGDTDEYEEQPTPTEAQAETVSLSEFLSKMFCTACPKRCPLSSPRCGRSASLVQKATVEYQTLYGDE